jgi:hypothetical protein
MMDMADKYMKNPSSLYEDIKEISYEDAENQKSAEKVIDLDKKTERIEEL